MPVRDEDLACLSKLKNLKKFSINSRSLVTDAGIAYLKDLPEMREFWGGGPYLTDKSLSYFSNIKTLNDLTIYGNFTDEGLRHFEGLKSLERLKICSAKSNKPSGKAL